MERHDISGRITRTGTSATRVFAMKRHPMVRAHPPVSLELVVKGELCAGWYALGGEEADPELPVDGPLRRDTRDTVRDLQRPSAS